MPHEVDGQVHWHEPAGLSAAGIRRYLRPALAYDRFMEDDVPGVLRAAGVASLHAVERGLWRRIAGRGRYLQLYGTEGGLGTALIEVPASAGLRPEKHLFEELLFVLDGRGTTELWLEGDAERVMFEWQPGSLFAIPPNALHRLVNATNAPALLLSLTTAPALINAIGDIDAIFANPYRFRARFDAETGQAFDDVEPDPVRGLAICRTSLVPDAVHCDLPLDNRQSPGWRQLEAAMAGSALSSIIGEHRPGRYGRAQLRPADTVSLCLRGTGFCHLWPQRLGPTPWQDGQGAEVLHMALQPGTLIGGGGMFVQSFNTGPGPLRLLDVALPQRPMGPPGEEIRDPLTHSLAEGGGIIPYSDEDPAVRAHYAETLAALSLPNRMRAEDYAA